MSTYTAMPNATHNIPVELTTIQCGKCGGVYAIGERYRAKKLEEGAGWNCPYCQCSWGYFKNGENARLKRELEYERVATQRARQERDVARDSANHFQKSRNGMKGVLVKERKRVGNGVCPCCNRTFADLQRHMSNKHPGHKNYPASK